MSTNGNSPTLDQALQGVPAVFRARLLKCYRNLKSAYSENRHDLSGLRAGKFCEVLLIFLQQHLTGTHIPFGTKIPNFTTECSALEALPKTTGPESLRLIIPRAINFLYTLRNKRGIGHEGGDVDANSIDSVTCVRVADWCMCELLRIFHKISLEVAQSLLDAMATRQIPAVWEVMGRKRILAQSLDFRSQVLLLLYFSPTEGIPVEDLFEWTEHSNKSNFQTAVIAALHRQRLIEYDRETATAIISPTGVRKVEDEILSQLNQ